MKVMYIPFEHPATKGRVALGKNLCIFAIFLKKNVTKLAVSNATHVSGQTANK